MRKIKFSHCKNYWFPKLTEKLVNKSLKYLSENQNLETALNEAIELLIEQGVQLKAITITKESKELFNKFIQSNRYESDYGVIKINVARK